MLVNGKWTANWDPVQATDNKGGFVALFHLRVGEYFHAAK